MPDSGSSGLYKEKDSCHPRLSWFRGLQDYTLFEGCAYVRMNPTSINIKTVHKIWLVQDFTCFHSPQQSKGYVLDTFELI